MQPLSYRELTQPAVEPVSLDVAKQQLVVDASFTDDDNLIGGLIVAARQHCEQLMNRAIFNRSMQITLDYFPYPDYSSTVNPVDRHSMYGRYSHQFAIKLPKPSCVSVQSITYVDLSGNTQTVESSLYRVDANSEPARITPKVGLYWPYSQTYDPGSITILYTAGTYGDGVEVNNCPQTIIQAMLLLISYWYNHRDSAETNPPKAIEMGVDALLAGETFETFGLV